MPEAYWATCISLSRSVGGLHNGELYTTHALKNCHTTRTRTSGLVSNHFVNLLLHANFRLLKGLLKMSSSYSWLLFSFSCDPHAQFKVSTLVNSPHPQNPPHHTKVPSASDLFCISLLNFIFVFFFLWVDLKWSSPGNLHTASISYNANLIWNALEKFWLQNEIYKCDVCWLLLMVQGSCKIVGGNPTHIVSLLWYKHSGKHLVLIVGAYLCLFLKRIIWSN